MNDYYIKKILNLSINNKFINRFNPNVGCLVILKNKIINKSWHYKFKLPHAEILALSNISYKSNKSKFYLNLEPCNYYSNTPPCCKILINAKIYKIFILNKDLNYKIYKKGIKDIKKSSIKIIKNKKIYIKEAKFINKDFFKRKITKLPWIKLKIALSINNKYTTLYNKKKRITSKKSKNNVQKERFISNSILSNKNTILIDNPLLNTRLKKLNYKIKNIINNSFQPIKIIIDEKNKIKPYHKLISNFNLINLIRFKKDNEKWPNNVKQIILMKFNKYINLYNLFFLLGTKINNILIETGSILSNFLLINKIIDELIVYISPIYLNNKEKNFFIFKKKKNNKFIFYNFYLINFDIYLTLINLN